MLFSKSKRSLNCRTTCSIRAFRDFLRVSSPEIQKKTIPFCCKFILSQSRSDNNINIYNDLYELVESRIQHQTFPNELSISRFNANKVLLQHSMQRQNFGLFPLVVLVEFSEQLCYGKTLRAHSKQCRHCIRFINVFGRLMPQSSKTSNSTRKRKESVFCFSSEQAIVLFLLFSVD